MGALLNFNAAAIAPGMSLETIPSGWYKAIVDESELKPTKDNASTGNAYLELRFSVLEGQYAGRKLFARINIKNQNPTAQEIAYKELSTLCHAVGILQVGDSQQLHNLPMQIKVKLRPARQEKGPDGQVIAEYEASNSIADYKSIHENVGGGTGAPAGAGIPPGFAPQAAGGMPTGFNPGAAAPQPFAQPAPQGAPAGWPVPGQAAVAQPPAQPAPVVQPPAQPATPPLPPAAPVAPPALPPVLTMTAKANGQSADAFRSNGWTDQQLVEHGYAVLTQPQAPATAVIAAAPQAPQAPQAPGAPAVGPSNPAGAIVPPWVK